MGGVRGTGVEIRFAKQELMEASTPVHDHAHQWELAALRTEVASQATVQVPPRLLKAQYGKHPVELHPAGLELLKKANEIAWMARLLLDRGQGNQRLSVAKNVANPLAVSFMRAQDRGPDRMKSTAVNALIAGTGNCGEHAAVAFELAKMMNISAAYIQDEENDHAYVALEEELEDGSKVHVVVDAWTTIPTVCLAEDYAFEMQGPRIRQADTYWKDSGVAPRINLGSIDMLRRQLRRARGPNAIAEASTERERLHRRLKSDVLDDYARRQGVRTYSRIDPSSLPAAEQARFKSEMKKIDKRIEKHVLKSVKKPTHDGRSLLWDARHNAVIINAYKAFGQPDSEAIRFDRAPQHVIDEAIAQRKRAREKGFYVYDPSTTSLAKAFRGNWAKRWAEKSRQALEGTLGIKKSQIAWDDEYVRKMNKEVAEHVLKAREDMYMLTRPEQESSDPAMVARAQTDLLAKIESRLEDLPQDDLDWTVSDLIEEFNTFCRAAQLEVATLIQKWAPELSRQDYEDVVKRSAELWINHFNDPVLESRFRKILHHYAPVEFMVDSLACQALTDPTRHEKARDLIQQRMDELRRDSYRDFESVRNVLTKRWSSAFNTRLEAPLREILDRQWPPVDMIYLLGEQVLDAGKRPELAAQLINTRLHGLEGDERRSAVNTLADFWSARIGHQEERRLRDVLLNHMRAVDLVPKLTRIIMTGQQDPIHAAKILIDIRDDLGSAELNAALRTFDGALSRIRGPRRDGLLDVIEAYVSRYEELQRSERAYATFSLSNIEIDS